MDIGGHCSKIGHLKLLIMAAYPLWFSDLSLTIFFSALKILFSLVFYFLSSHYRIWVLSVCIVTHPHTCPGEGRGGVLRIFFSLVLNFSYNLTYDCIFIR